MKAECVSSILRWMRRSDRDFAEITLAQLFRTAYFANNGTVISDAQLQSDLAEYAQGKVCWYVCLFMRKQMYKAIVTVNPDPHPPLLF